MKAYAEDKLSKLDRMGERIIDITLTMDIQKLDHRVDIVMKYGHTLIKSHGISNDMYVSIDQAINKLQRQLRKYKGRLKEHHAKDYPIGEIPETIYSPGFEALDEEEANFGIDNENEKGSVGILNPHKIVKVDAQPLKILTDDEAIMKMELSGASAMVYKHEGSRRLKVIYRREDGNYGVIEAE
jgi:putative sigma-54 modulation protein